MRWVGIIAVVLVISGAFYFGCRSSIRTDSTDDPSGLGSQRTHGAPDNVRRAVAINRYSSPDEADARSTGCLSCHTETDSKNMHPDQPFVYIGCVDCHGGDATVCKPVEAPNVRPYAESYLQAMRSAHISPRLNSLWSDPVSGEYSSANPVRSYSALNREDPAFIQFVNPGDLRVADQTCGACHEDIVRRVKSSMMTHGAQLWAAALYNNGSYPSKVARFGESYSPHGVPQRLLTNRALSADERARGVLQYLDPLPRWEITQMGNILRAFERGGKVSRIEVDSGLPNVFEEPGKPDMKLSDRGLGTQLATDPVFLNLQKTRLLDPILSFMGTNEHPGDFRSSGCSACHVVYANDRSPIHSLNYAGAGHRGFTATVDPTIKKEESGHPIRHAFTRSPPSSQCVVCHMHPGTSFASSFFGFTWWDNETHGELMYPAKHEPLAGEEVGNVLRANPEGSALRGLWSNARPDAFSAAGATAGESFLERTSELNDQLDKTQFADFHGHGWIFRAVFKQDRTGRLLDRDGAVIGSATPRMLQDAVAFTSGPGGAAPPAGHPVHLKDIHLERGMHCVDCHFEQDVHGDGMLYGEVRNAIEIDCIDCHGTIKQRSTLVSSGPAGGNDLGKLQTPFGRRFDRRGGRIYQRSAAVADLEWEVPQLVDIVDPGSPRYNPKAAYAKTLRRGSAEKGFSAPRSEEWGDPRCPESDLAHGNDNMTCYACHSSWMTSCFGCHLPMRANFRMPMLHNEGEWLRNFTTYNFQVLRDDVFMIGKDSTVKGGRVAPVRSSSAVIVGSQNANREWAYSQQQTVSSEGFSGQAFNPHFPHAVRTTETRSCTDCHVSETNDNNAWMAQLLLQGTNLVNFIGRYMYVAEGDHGFQAVVVTEADEPQAVIGGYLHSLAYPEQHQEHIERNRELELAYEHKMNDGLFPVGGEILDLQVRGEYVYTARGEGGFYAYDIANIDNKGFSERIVTAPVSPLGQSLHVKTKYATCVASPSTLAVDPTRTRFTFDTDKPRGTMLDPAAPWHINQEQAIHPVYAYLYVTDLYEGLVVIGDKRSGIGTLLDGDPTNNFLKRAIAFNPDGVLNGAAFITLAGHWAYICCDRGLVIVDLSNPLEPQVAAEIGSPHIVDPRAVAVQFRYAFVTDRDGLKVVDVTDPQRAQLVESAFLTMADPHRLYLARTYAYVAGGREGLLIVDVENPEQIKLAMTYSADGAINDARDVKIGMANASAFAYVADGKNGLRVIQLTSPRDTPGYGGFSPRPTPQLIASYPTKGPALALSKGLDRDRAVDESGHQLAVFGRLGARPLTLEEQRRLYMRDGLLYRVTNEVPKRDAQRTSPLTLSK